MFFVRCSVVSVSFSFLLFSFFEYNSNRDSNARTHHTVQYSVHTQDKEERATHKPQA